MIKVLLNVPFRTIETLKEGFDDWFQVYDYYQDHIVDASLVTDMNQIQELEPDDEEVQEETDRYETDDFHQFEHVSATGYNQQIPGKEIGTRDFDKNENWHLNTIDNQQIKDLKMFMENLRKDLHGINNAVESSIVLNTEQQEVIDLFEIQLKQFELTENTRFANVPRKIIIEGKAGSGKSTVLKYMTRRLAEIYGENSYLLLAPTGVAAINVNGSTIQLKLKIHPYNNSKLNPLSGTNLSDFQKELKDLKFVFIDEMSMVGQKMLDYIEKRLNSAKNRSDFGGLCIYLFGDFNQLPPVKDDALYRNISTPGRILFKTFQKYFLFNTSVRQQGNSSSQISFRGILNRIGDTTVTKDDWKELMNRCWSNILNKQEFKNALYLFTTNNEVKAKNEVKLFEFNKPICLIKSIDTDEKIEKTDVSKILPKNLTICIGCRVMLRVNLSVETGLVNGSLGTVTGIV